MRVVIPFLSIIAVLAGVAVASDISAKTSEDDRAGATAPAQRIETFDHNDSAGDRRHIRTGLRIAHRLDDGPWQFQNATYPRVGQQVRLRVRNDNVAHIRWYLIFADITRIYQNANRPGETGAYKWTGIDSIAYHRIEIDDAREMREIDPIAQLDTLVSAISRWARDQGASPRVVDFYKSEHGTFWFQVEGEIDGVAYRSIGLDDMTDRGISTRAFRMSLRQSDDFLGWISTFYNVPGVFGSVLYQSRHYLGADCADVMMSAWHKWKQKNLTKNFNVQMLVTRFPKRAETRIHDGTPAQPVLWGKDVAPGDLITVRNADSKKFHHVGALVGDTNQNGILDADDQIIHAGPYPLHLSSLKEGAFDGHVVVLRP